MKARNILWIVPVLSLAVAAAAEEIVETISWPGVGAAAELTNARVVTNETPAFLSVEGISGEGPLTVLRLIKPQITQPRYALTGEVRYRDVSGEGYLEMWNHFSDTEAYFSRTLSSGGPMQSLRGSSPWRPFLLPFIKGEKEGPRKLVVNVVLPEGGSVDLRELRLVQYEEGRAPAIIGGRGDAWWGPRTGGLIGAVVGISLGLLLPAIAFLIHSGRARTAARALTLLLHVVGDACLVVGVVALVKGQPYAVYYPLILVGFLTALLTVTMLFRDRRLQGLRELRRVQAMDAG